jgi:hypothetical protein
MRTKSPLAIFFLCVLLNSCTTVKTRDFFKLEENKIETYNGVFIKNANDNNYRQVEQLYGSISKSDTIIGKTEIVHKAIDIDGNKAFYAVATKDTLRENPNIGTNYFLGSALIFSNDTTFIAPVYEKADLTKLTFNDFKYKIPPSVTKKDSVVIIDRKKRMVLYNFRKTTLTIDNKKFADCLSFEIRDVWPDALYGEKIWLHKRYGLLKWIRSTGRIETRAF